MMRIIVGLLLLTGTSFASESDTHDGGWDAGGTAAFVGGMTVLSLWSTTALATGIGDGLCGLGESADSCAHPHTSLYIPLVGGFLPGRDDWSQNIGIASSVLQVAAAGLMVGGLVVHHWHVKNAQRAAR
jgi:hypothetical protein